MARRICLLLVSVLFLSSVLTLAKKKEKQLLPDLVLRAQTVAVIIQPNAGEPMSDPTTNRKAQEDVEKALMKWGRFRFVMETSSADLVISVRKGSDKLATPTISGGQVDNRPVVLESTDNAIRIGAQQGRPPDQPQSQDASSSDGRAHTGMEVGQQDDSFRVYLGGPGYSPGGSPVWSYVAKNALRPPNVPAVEEFHKAITDSEKAAAQKQPTPPAPKSTP
jgi:hypothetical protein